MTTAPANIETLTLFVDDLAAARAFYAKVFAPETLYEDDVCTVMRFGGVAVNILSAGEAPALIAPARVAEAGAGSRALLTIVVDDVDAVCAALARQGVPLINGPLDRPWGRRTAAFADPAGHVWEVAQILPTPAP